MEAGKLFIGKAQVIHKRRPRKWRGIELYTKLSTISTFLCPFYVVYIEYFKNTRFVKKGKTTLL